ncbi:thioredoxin reductase 1, cytoplasmic [Patella vulgata]|uniref:thioredoxin reductase 1, cytoplasmic n=1 Tax=Patella vulgata TaxID=6465 RepID=UPI00217F74CF|nr:thioredoxin reductase 1, cytoplasmic [Patella vulgata]
MPPVQGDLKTLIQGYIDKNKVMIFSKTTCPFCAKVKDLFKSLNVEYFSLEMDKENNMADLQNTLLEISGQKTVPNVYINGTHLGGCDSTLKAHSDNKLLQMINAPNEKYDYDLIVIGGGSGGLSAAKAAAELGKKVALLDFVKPTPQGTSWGLGGTCVNVGCIPKKLMHRSAILGEELSDAQSFGWDVKTDAKHSWDKMRDAIQDHIGSLNWNYRVQLREKSVTYLNAYGEFIGPHRLKTTKKNNKVEEITGETFIIATGERPRYPDIPGAKEYTITSDDLFSLPYCPGKTLCIGASYVSLECAGFLAGLGLDVTVMVRSILLRGFDQQIAEYIGEYMSEHKIFFHRGYVPVKIEKLEDGQPGKYKVTAKSTTTDDIIEEEYNTILLAIGRDPCTSGIGLEAVGVQLNPKNGKLLCNEKDQTNIDYIYGIGDIVQGVPELTPVAIQAGRLLVNRLYDNSNTLCDYQSVATTVFTPIEYGCIGYSEEAALEKFGEENIEIYHSNYYPLEWTVPHREENVCYAKLICLIPEKERVVGFHVLGPNAGEITQGYSIAMRKGATKEDFDMTIGIHPTCSEIFTTMNITKRSGGDTAVAGC